MSHTALDYSVLDGLKPGDLIKVRFKTDRLELLAWVQKMHQFGVLSVDKRDRHFLDAVQISGGWNGEHNRTQTFAAGSNWNAGYFRHRLGPAIEWLEITRANR